jgi:hypothetical protein
MQDIPDELIETYMSRLINHPEIWFEQWVSKEQKCQYACRKPGDRYYRKIDGSLIRCHLNGVSTVSLPAASSEGTSKWLCFDNDKDNGQLDRMQVFLGDWGWNTLREARRPGREGHLWLLLDRPIETEKAVSLGDAMMRLAGVVGVERFPKTATGLSTVRGPLGVHRKPGAGNARGWFDGPAHDVIEQLLWLSKQPLNSASAALKEAERHKPPARKLYPARFSTGVDKLSAAEIAERLDAKRAGNGWQAHCPAHEDSVESLSIRRGEKHPLLLYCHAGCSYQQILDALKRSRGC